VLPGRRLGSTATRLLHYLLPLCLLAAAVVASQGLLHVISRTSPPAVSSSTVSLTLGAAGEPAARPVDSPKPVTPKRSPAATPIPVAVTSPVAIFNASDVRGLATHIAAFLREQGVVVTSVDNLTGGQKPALQTVFYSPGQQAQARTLANLSGAAEVAPAPDWIPAAGRLVLVLTAPAITSATGPFPRS
jgi:hypothetical protein